jgi:hypothetical protein
MHRARYVTEGVYSEPTGMVNLVSESRIDHVFKRGAGLMRGVVTSGDGGGGNNSNGSESETGGDASYREALRIAGRDIIGHPWDPTATEGDALRPEHVPGSPG